MGPGSYRTSSWLFPIWQMGRIIQFFSRPPGVVVISDVILFSLTEDVGSSSTSGIAYSVQYFKCQASIPAGVMMGSDVLVLC